MTDFWVAVSASVYGEMKPYLDYSKEKNIPEGMEDYAGDVWTWAAIDRDTKLIKSWFAGGREADSANVFMQDVASRITNKYNYNRCAPRLFGRSR